MHQLTFDLIVKNSFDIFPPELVCICTAAPQIVAAYTAEPDVKEIWNQTKHVL